MVSTFGSSNGLVGAVGIDAHGVDRRLVAGRVGAHRIGRVGDDRVAAGGRDQRHVRHVVDRELAERLALRDALGQQARRDAVRRRHAVADEQDDVLRLARPGVVDGPGDLARCACRRVTSTRVGAGLRQRRRRAGSAPTGPCRPRARRRSRPCRTPWRSPAPFTVTLSLARLGEAGELDLEVEMRAHQDVGAVDRIDRSGRGRGCGQTDAITAVGARKRRMAWVLRWGGRGP